MLKHTPLGCALLCLCGGGLCHNTSMVRTHHVIIGQLRTQIERTEIRLRTYARQYEAFRQFPIPEDGETRDLQLSIAYLYHTSLSILEERRQSLEDYYTDVTDVLDSVDEVADPERATELRENVLSECQHEITTLTDELRHIDEGVAAAHRHQRELLFDE